MKNLTYDDCCKFIEGITDVTVFKNENAANLSSLVSRYGMANKLLMIEGKNKNALLFPSGNKYWAIYF